MGGAIKLYFDPVSVDPVTVNCRKFAAGFGLMGMSFEKAHVDCFKAEQMTPEYLKINPNGAIPALVDGDMKLWESNAIQIGRASCRERVYSSV